MIRKLGPRLARASWSPAEQQDLCEQVGMRKRPATYVDGSLAGSRPRRSESQSIEPSQRPCARPRRVLIATSKQENRPANVIGQKHLPSVTKIPQRRLSNRSQSNASRKTGEPRCRLPGLPVSALLLICWEAFHSPEAPLAEITRNKQRRFLRYRAALYRPHTEALGSSAQMRCVSFAEPAGV